MAVLFKLLSHFVTRSLSFDCDDIILGTNHYKQGDSNFEVPGRFLKGFEVAE